MLTVSGSRFKFGDRLGNSKLYKMNCGSSCFFASVDVVTTDCVFNGDSESRCSSSVGVLPQADDDVSCVDVSDDATSTFLGVIDEGKPEVSMIDEGKPEVSMVHSLDVGVLDSTTIPFNVVCEATNLSDVACDFVGTTNISNVACDSVGTTNLSDVADDLACDLGVVRDDVFDGVHVECCPSSERNEMSYPQLN